MIKAVIFDIDGTLIDSVDLHARAWQEAFRKYGHDIPFEKVRHQIGKGGDQLMPVFLTKDQLSQYGHELESYRVELYKKQYLPQAQAFPKVRELFARLIEDGKRIALASSAKEDEVDAYKEKAHIQDLIDTATSADDAERSKPHPDIFVAALEGLGRDYRRDEIVIVGDSPYDMTAAAKLHVKTVGLLCGGFPEAELRAQGCEAIYRDPADLLARYPHTPFTEGKRAATR